MKTIKNARSNGRTLEQATSTQTPDKEFEARNDFITLPPGLQGRLALKPREAAPLIGVGVNCIYELCRRADFPAIRVGESSIIIPVDALRRWLDAQAENGKGRYM